jgi:hypothetical protein
MAIELHCFPPMMYAQTLPLVPSNQHATCFPGTQSARSQAGLLAMVGSDCPVKLLLPSETRYDESESSVKLSNPGRRVRAD